MADMKIDGKTYSTDALCVFQREDDTGDWEAVLHGYHHAVAHTPRMAVLRLADHLKRQNMEQFYKDRHHFDEFLQPYGNEDSRE